jgi:anthranilate synthase component 1
VFHRHDLESVPDLLALHQSKPDAYPYLLASNTSGHRNSRYSILMCYPESVIEQAVGAKDILSLIDTPLDASSPELTELPFIGGWFVFLGYEYACQVEPSVHFYPQTDTNLPRAFISRVPGAVIIDHQHCVASVVCDANHPHLLDVIRGDIEQAQAFAPQPLPEASIDEEQPDIYRNSLRRIHDYIREGDIFQANLSRLWQVELDSAVDPAALYARLRDVNPSPFAALVRHKDAAIISSSPERLVLVQDGIAETRPIAGTHPRDDDQKRDHELSSQLLGHPKERAEHVMLIDLERNDLGRVCVPGSIRVEDRMVLESYRTVHHIVSSIRGELQAGMSVRDVIHAVFPGGTITGCPKVRCMQIISELEGQARGAYTGSLGYVSDHGRIDLNILIRTLTLQGKRIQFRAGAGIVSDSIIEKELNETRHKARGMLNAFSADY